MKHSRSKFKLSFAVLGLILIGGLLIPGVSGAMTSMDSSNCPQQVTCNICISADIPEIQKTEQNHPRLSQIIITAHSLTLLPSQPASPPPKA
jgi:hypothetical protein